ncbi:MAG: hypothetical protein H6779_05415 [Candidatus Nomurabacteria bacterium]|nr:MAG: hypothetical protein H6779_05415 [Candidatus Nomurabacteria bacterium]
MTRQDTLSVLITFVIGLVAGGYYYITGFSFKDSDVSTKDTYSDFAIVGKAYGNCQSDGCLSFQLLSDGTYRVLLNKADVGEVSKEGVVPKTLRKELTDNIETLALKQLSKKVSTKNCSSMEGGVDYNFKITRAGTDYELDTCKTNINYNTEAWSSLAKLWNYFETIE